MANSPELKLNITTNAEQIKAASSRIEQLTNALKIVELRARQGKISAEQYSKALSGITNEANKLNVSLKQAASVQQSFFLSQQRITSGFTSMSGSLHNLTQASNRSQQGFMALAYIIQDMPYGIRGVANNITQLSQVLGTPIGINIAISALTSLMVILSNTKNEADSAKTALSSLDSDIRKIYEGLDRMPYATALASKEARLASAKERVAEEARKAATTETYISGYQTGKGGTFPIYKTRIVQVMSKELEDAMKEVASIEVEIDNFKGQYKKRLEKAREKELNALGVSFADTEVGSENWKRKFDRSLDDKIAKGFRKKERLVPSIVRPEEDYSELKEAVNTYNTVFFDPLRAGFKQIGEEIRTSLFGSLDAMRDKFGNVAAAILDSLSRVIAKLIETAIAASLLSFLFPGAGGFGTMFKNLIMPGQLITPTNNGLANSLATGGNIGGMQTVRVIGESVVSGDNILIVYKNAEYKRSVSRI